MAGQQTVNLSLQKHQQLECDFLNIAGVVKLVATLL